jgi:hypothetical protein
MPLSRLKGQSLFCFYITVSWTKPLRGGLKLATTYVTSVDPFSVAGPSLEDDPIPPLDEKA